MPVPIARVGVHEDQCIPDMASPVFPQPMVKADGRTAAGVAHEPATGAADAAFVPDPAFFAAFEEADADASAVSCDVAPDALAVDEPVEPGTTAGALEAGAVLVAVEDGAVELLLGIDEEEVEEEELDVDEEEDELDAADDEVAGVVATVVLIALSAPDEQPAIRTRGMAASAIRFTELV